MKENKKPVHGNRERVTETAALTGASFSNNHCSTAAGDRQAGFVESLLPHGEAHAVTTAQLVAMCGYHSARELQQQIERERLSGSLILSKAGAGGGYFLPAEGEAGQLEIAAFVRTVHARAVNSLRTIKAARDALKNAEGQTSFFEEVGDDADFASST